MSMLSTEGFVLLSLLKKTRSISSMRKVLSADKLRILGVDAPSEATLLNLEFSGLVRRKFAVARPFRPLPECTWELTHDGVDKARKVNDALRAVTTIWG